MRLTAPPSDGAANAALIRLIAKAMRVAKQDVTLASGATSRLKRLHIRGEPAALVAALAHIVKDKA